MVKEFNFKEHEAKCFAAETFGRLAKIAGLKPDDILDKIDAYHFMYGYTVLNIQKAIEIDPKEADLILKENLNKVKTLKPEYYEKLIDIIPLAVENLKELKELKE